MEDGIDFGPLILDFEVYIIEFLVLFFLFLELLLVRFELFFLLQVVSTLLIPERIDLLDVLGLFVAELVDGRHDLVELVSGGERVFELFDVVNQVLLLSCGNHASLVLAFECGDLSLDFVLFLVTLEHLAVELVSLVVEVLHFLVNLLRFPVLDIYLLFQDVNEGLLLAHEVLYRHVSALDLSSTAY